MAFFPLLLCSVSLMYQQSQMHFIQDCGTNINRKLVALHSSFTVQTDSWPTALLCRRFAWLGISRKYLIVLVQVVACLPAFCLLRMGKRSCMLWYLKPFSLHCVVFSTQLEKTSEFHPFCFSSAVCTNFWKHFTFLKFASSLQTNLKSNHYALKLLKSVTDLVLYWLRI